MKGGLVKRVARRLGKRTREAFAFLVATAWAELFNDVFELVIGDRTNILMRVLYALAFTVVASVVAMMFDEDDDNSSADHRD